MEQRKDALSALLMKNGAADICEQMKKYALSAEELAEAQSQIEEEKHSFLCNFRSLADFQEQTATWLIPGWIPEGQITLLAADGGVGKTSLWCDFAAAISSGRPCILDPPAIRRDPGLVAFLTTEDSVRKKLKRKLRLAGANEGNIITPDFQGDKDGSLRKLKFGTDEMAQFIRHFKPKFCIFDPIQGFVPPEINMGNRNAMRDCMAPLVSLGEEVGTSFLVVCHSNKRKGASGRDRIADSADLWDIARSVMMAGYTETEGVRYLSNEKNNYDGLQETRLFSIDNDGRPHLEGTSWKRDREYQQDAADARSAPKRDDCKDFIVNRIETAGGCMTAKSLESLANSAGYSPRTIRRAREDLQRDGTLTYERGKNGSHAPWELRLSSYPSQEFVELPPNEETPWT